MVAVKTYRRIRKNGIVRMYYYLVENYTENGEKKSRVLRSLSKVEAETIKRNKKRDKPKTKHKIMLQRTEKRIEKKMRVLQDEAKKAHNDLLKEYVSYKEHLESLTNNGRLRYIPIAGLDHIRKRIVNLLDEEGWLTCREIGEMLEPIKFISNGLWSMFNYRLERLVEEGYVVKRIKTIKMNLGYIGRYVTFYRLKAVHYIG